MNAWNKSRKETSATTGRRSKRGPARASVVVATLLMAVSSIFFNNCSNEFTVSESESGLPSFLSVCEGQLLETFASKVYPFTSTMCVSCHGGEGPSNDPFAAPNRVMAFQAFDLVGIEKLKAYATNSGHAPGVTGSHNERALTTMQESVYLTLSNPSCKNEGRSSGNGADLIKTVAKPINAPTGTGQARTWNLGSELETGPLDLGGATFEITVRQVAPAGGKPSYYFSRPILKTAMTDVDVKEIHVWINNKRVESGTTFSEIDAHVPAATTNQPLSTATMVVERPDGIRTTDVISVSFAYLMRGSSTDPNPNPAPIPTPSPTPPPVTDGAQLYTMHCASCHGQLANSTRKGRTATQIREALDNVPAMSNIVLNDAQVQAIAQALQ